MDPMADLWVDNDLAEEIPLPNETSLPIVTRLQVLPLDQLPWPLFEQLCWRLASRQGDVVDSRRYGVGGQNQQGIDILLRMVAPLPLTTWQCKRYETFSPSDLSDAVDEFLAGKWAKTNGTLRLAVTADLSRRPLVDEIETQAARCRERGIEFGPLDINALSMLLKDQPDLVDDFFARHWVTAFCGQEASDRLGQRRMARNERVKARKRLRSLYTSNFATADPGLPAAAGALPLGRLSLHDRYILPHAQAVIVMMESRSQPSPPNPEPSVDTPETSPRPDQQGEARQRNGAGFRPIETRTKTELFDWLSATNRAVIIADAGLGKSVSLRFVALDLLSDAPRSEVLAQKWAGFHQSKPNRCSLPFCLNLSMCRRPQSRKARPSSAVSPNSRVPEAKTSSFSLPSIKARVDRQASGSRDSRCRAAVSDPGEMRCHGERLPSSH